MSSCERPQSPISPRTQARIDALESRTQMMKAFIKQCTQKTSLDDLIFEAMSNDDVDLFRCCLEFDIGCKVFEGFSPLTFAAKNGFDKYVLMLLDHGVDIDALDAMKNTALFRACQAGHLSTVCILFDRGAKSNIDLGQAFLFLDNPKRDIEIIEFLESQGVEVFKSKRDVPLLKKGYPWEAIEFFCKRDNFYIYSAECMYLVQQALLQNKGRDIVDLICARTDDFKKVFCMCFSTLASHEDILYLADKEPLLLESILIGFSNNMHQDTSLVALLVERSTEPLLNAVEAFVRFNKPDAVFVMIDSYRRRNMLVNVKGHERLLAFVIMLGHSNIMERIGLPLNNKVFGMCEECIEGSVFETRDKRTAALQSLENACDLFDMSKVDLEFVKGAQVAQILLKKGAQVNAQFDSCDREKEYRGDTALHRALRSNNVELVRVLLQHGADTSIANSFKTVAKDMISSHAYFLIEAQETRTRRDSVE